MRKLILCILVILYIPVDANATVIEFHRDGSVTTFAASDYLADQRRKRIEPLVTSLPPKTEPIGIFDIYVQNSSIRHGVDSNLIRAIIHCESSNRAKVVSSKGAQGLMQLMPATAKRFGVEDALDPEQNIEGGTKYLSFLLKRYEGDIRLTVAAYNAGEGTIDKYGDVPPYPETRTYVRKVQEVLDALYYRSASSNDESP